MKKIMLMVVLCAAISVAQERGQSGRRPMERLESFKKVRMLEAMNLDEEKGLKLVSRYNEHRDDMRNLEKERKEIMDGLEKKVSSGGSDSDLQKSFNDLADIEKRMLDHRATYLNELKEILTARQIAEYLIFERNFARDIRDIMREGQKERMRR